jgi:hypothetical protein
VADEERHAQVHVVHGGVVQIEAVLAERLAVVAGDDHDAVVEQPVRLRLGMELRQLGVHQLDGAVVARPQHAAAGRREPEALAQVRMSAELRQHERH